MPAKEKIRLDKIFSESNLLSRSETKAAAKKGRITVNGITVKSAEEKVNETDVITLDGVSIIRRRFFYIMMNKPEGYVCSTDDPASKTVLELLEDRDRPADIFPAGRLDKDTVGFLLLTNDGNLAHALLSPKKHAEKTYLFKCVKPLSPQDTARLERGVPLDGAITKPARITCEGCSGTITLTEGKFHQIKRMFGFVGNEIIYLKRISFGGILLDDKLEEGGYRYITENELKILKNHV